MTSGPWMAYGRPVAKSASGSPSGKLPRGRYALPPGEVQRIHRERLYLALAKVMVDKGYARTSVEDVLKKAGVSRRAFYQLFESKLDCFLGAFGAASEILQQRMLAPAGVDSAGQLGAAGDPMDLFERIISSYLCVLTEELPYARLFLVEAYAAGPEAVRRRAEVQADIADAFVALVGATGPAGRFTCAMIIAAVSSMVTVPLARNDPDSLQKIGPPVIEYVRRLWHAGAFTEPPNGGVRQ